ncbi:MAG: methyltransferase [Vicinamibacterales bacterium]
MVIDWRLLTWAALVLSLERICYVCVWRLPDRFLRVCGALKLSGPQAGPTGLRWLFYGFKGLQGLVFVAWCLSHGSGLWPSPAPSWAVGVGAALVVVGQGLNVSVFRRLGADGVFYGCRFGRPVAWCREFPYSWFAHPQYVGAVVSITGLFLALRYPHPDWYVLPVLEAVYYMAGARLER